MINTLSPASLAEGCLDIVDRDRSVVRECDDTAPNQQWKLTPIKGGYHRLTAQGIARHL